MSRRGRTTTSIATAKRVAQFISGFSEDTLSDPKFQDAVLSNANLTPDVFNQIRVYSPAIADRARELETTGSAEQIRKSVSPGPPGGGGPRGTSSSTASRGEQAGLRKNKYLDASSTPVSRTKADAMFHKVVCYHEDCGGSFNTIRCVLQGVRGTGSVRTDVKFRTPVTVWTCDHCPEVSKGVFGKEREPDVANKFVNRKHDGSPILPDPREKRGAKPLLRDNGKMASRSPNGGRAPRSAATGRDEDDERGTPKLFVRAPVQSPRETQNENGEVVYYYAEGDNLEATREELRHQDAAAPLEDEGAPRDEEIGGTQQTRVGDTTGAQLLTTEGEHLHEAPWSKREVQRSSKKRRGKRREKETAPVDGAGPPSVNGRLAEDIAAFVVTSSSAQQRHDEDLPPDRSTDDEISALEPRSDDRRDESRRVDQHFPRVLDSSSTSGSSSLFADARFQDVTATLDRLQDVLQSEVDQDKTERRIVVKMNDEPVKEILLTPSPSKTNRDRREDVWPPEKEMVGGGTASSKSAGSGLGGTKSSLGGPGTVVYPYRSDGLGSSVTGSIAVTREDLSRPLERLKRKGVPQGRGVPELYLTKEGR